MDRRVLIYGPNAVRGQIIQKVLAISGIAAEGYAGARAIEQVLVGRAAPVVILDLIGRLPHDLDLRRRLAQRTPEARFITLVEAPDASLVQTPCGVDEICVLAPVDPQYIRLLVETFGDGPIPLQTLTANQAVTVHTADQPLPIPVVVPTAAKRPRAPLSFRRWFPARLLRLASLLLALGIGLSGGYLLWCTASLPNVDILADYSPYQASVVYTDDNRRLTEFFEERRTVVPYDVLPETVTQALLAIEDNRYFKHSGVDPIRIVGALIADLKAGAIQQGGSTITQQLAKMIFLTPEKTIFRKVSEILLSLKIEQRYSKHEILNLYLNKAYFGAQAYGIDTASRTYFNKPAVDLTLPEAALLAGMLKAPSAYSPFGNPQAARERRYQVLKRMVEVGFIDRRQCDTADRAPLPSHYHGRRYEAAYFVDHCRQILEDRIGDRLYTSGLSIYTTLDYRLQQHAEAAVNEGAARLNALYDGNGTIQAALVSMEIDTGRIKAMVGGTDFWSSQFNRATQARRQPGSAFKPVVYLTALEQGYDPETLIEDIRRVYSVNGTDQRWSPRNYRNQYHGLVTLETALSRSMNAATVNLAKDVGIDAVIATAHRLGIESDIHRVYPSVLGASETTLLELVCAYAALAGGYRVTPVSIDRIIDRDRAIMIDPPCVRQPVIAPETLAAMRRMLRTVITDGTGRRALALDRVVYGKTGTTNNSGDALFIGFDDRLVTGVWVGRDDNAAIGRSATGGNAALPIWIQFMAAYGAPAGASVSPN